MKSKVGHVVFGVRPENLSFYKDLFAALGWNVIYDDPAMLGVGVDDHVSFWFGAPLKDVTNDYDGPGVNHHGINVETQEDVDTIAAYLKEHGIAHLFETPRHRPEWAENEGSTYYQVMFESPDRLLFEILYTGPKS